MRIRLSCGQTTGHCANDTYTDLPLHGTWHLAQGQQLQVLRNRFTGAEEFIAAKVPTHVQWYKSNPVCSRWKSDGPLAYKVDDGHSLPQHTSNAMCVFLHRLGRHQGILVVGDSINAHFTVELAAFFNAQPCRDSTSLLNFNSTTDKCHGTWCEMKMSWCICEGTQKLVFIRNDFLNTSTAFPNGICTTDRPDALCKPFSDADFLSQFSVVILNAGAHYQDDEKLMQTLHSAATLLSVTNNQTLLVYRNTVPGHGSCSNITEPFTSLQAAETWVSKSHPWFHGPFFPRQNEMAWSTFKTYGFRLLDAYTPGVQRGDAHRVDGQDCLHYCVPGPMTVWIDQLNTLIVETAGSYYEPHFKSFER